MLLYQVLASVKYGKKSTKTINLKYLSQCGMKTLNYQMSHILYQIFKIIFEYIIKKDETMTDNPPIKIYVNKIKNRVIFKIKGVYYLQMLTSETMKLFFSTKKR